MWVSVVLLLPAALGVRHFLSGTFNYTDINEKGITEVAFVTGRRSFDWKQLMGHRSTVGTATRGAASDSGIEFQFTTGKRKPAEVTVWQSELGSAEFVRFSFWAQANLPLVNEARADPAQQQPK